MRLRSTRTALGLLAVFVSCSISRAEDELARFEQTVCITLLKEYKTDGDVVLLHVSNLRLPPKRTGDPSPFDTATESRELKQPRFYDMTGKQLSASQVRKRVSGLMPIVLTRGEPLLPAYRKTFGEKTLNLVEPDKRAASK